ncbi:hypothetical protein Tcan_02840 [Toxocara canis]|uniref:Uncharacterized protein n=1 Tax=Toxocara canis TaxID=6265 RepID=A0A0B2V4R1_TOXCA|nr:hypothetical protein Tcan_02840 [Toxocara canis]
MGSFGGKMQPSEVPQRDPVRMLIVAVHFYTGRAVNVVAFSLGVPISRKAIMGGRCVETDEDLGDPLTPFIETFVGVSGPNHGAKFEACFLLLLRILS